MADQAALNPKLLFAFILFIIVAFPILSAAMFWTGYSALMSDSRIQTGGIETTARIVSLQRPQSGEHSRMGFARVRPAGTGETVSLQISRETWSSLSVGQEIRILRDPADPRRYQFDRSAQTGSARVFAIGGGIGLAMSLFLVVWALGGGLRRLLS